MKIVIIGAGEVGFHIASRLARENKNVVMIDNDPEAIRRITDSLDVQCIGLAVHPRLEFSVDDPQLKSKAATLFIQEMAKRGCHGYTSFYLNAAQGLDELDQTEAAAQALEKAVELGYDDPEHLLSDEDLLAQFLAKNM